MYSISDMKTALLLCFALPLLAQQIIPLPLDHPADPAAPPEKIEKPGTGGIVDRAILNVTQQSVTVYLPAKEKS